MTVQVNGEPRSLPDGASVSDLLTDLKLTPDKVAVELNRRLVRSDRYDTSLMEADGVEVVTFGGGGGEACSARLSTPGSASKRSRA